MRGFEGLLGRDALDPSLQGKLLVVGEIEADDQANLRWSTRLRFVFRRGGAPGF